MSREEVGEEHGDWRRFSTSVIRRLQKISIMRTLSGANSDPEFYPEDRTIFLWLRRRMGLRGEYGRVWRLRRIKYLGAGESLLENLLNCLGVRGIWVSRKNKSG